MKLFYVVLVILLFYNLGLTLYVFKINRRLKEFNQILLEIEKGQSKQKFLLKKNNRIDQVGFRVNSILYKYEKRIEESNIELEANKQLMTSLSHDVRTPMTTLIGYLDALDLKLVSSDKEEQYLRLAKEKAYDLKKYIEVLFEWFRINSDEEQLEIKAVDITEETRRIFLDWIPIIEEHRIGYNTINEQISNFAQSYPANSITASIEAPLLINRYRFVSCSCFSCFCKKA